jgi:transcriptional regulator with XRE-family HTH domain
VPDPKPAWVLDRRQAVGARIVKLRKEANITQRAVIEATGLQRSTVQEIEHGEVDPRLSSLLLIADAIGVPVASLFADPHEE